MRRRRNSAEYPGIHTTEIAPEEVVKDLAKAEDLLALATRVLDQMSPY
jgi:hypothetical protein